MPLIKTIKPEDATGELAQIYAQIKALRGTVPASSQLWSTSPELLKQQMSFIGYYIKHETLSAPLLACVRILVSGQTNCKYCVDFNSGMLVNMMGWSIEDVEELKTISKSSKLTPKENAILTFVAKSVKNNTKADEKELDALRTLGWSDADILDAVQHGARMLAIDIIFNTFDLISDDE
jgi:alkylhydroperoxidase family enzyme